MDMDCNWGLSASGLEIIAWVVWNGFDVVWCRDWEGVVEGGVVEGCGSDDDDDDGL